MWCFRASIVGFYILRGQHPYRTSSPLFFFYFTCERSFCHRPMLRCAVVSLLLDWIPRGRRSERAVMYARLRQAASSARRRPMDRLVVLLPLGLRLELRRCVSAFRDRALHPTPCASNPPVVSARTRRGKKSQCVKTLRLSFLLPLAVSGLRMRRMRPRHHASIRWHMCL